MSEGSTKQEPRKNKSNILRNVGSAVAGIVFGGAVAGAASAVHDANTTRSHISEISPTSTVTPENKIARSEKIGPVTLDYGVDGIPVSYSIDGKSFFVSKDQTEQMREAMKIAKEKQEPMQLMSILLPQPKPAESYKGTADRPREEKLPDDIMTDEELKANNLELIQANDTKIYIRKVAFEEGGFLHDLLLAKDLKIKLRIVAFDTAILPGDTSDPKYAEVKDLMSKITQTPEDYQKQQIDDLNTQVFI